MLLAGPSSGKTTTCKRLSIQLLANGIKPLVALSLDDYFVDRNDTPKRRRYRNFDYESIYAQRKLINEQFNALFRGKK